MLAQSHVCIVLLSHTTTHTKPGSTHELFCHKHCFGLISFQAALELLLASTTFLQSNARGESGHSCADALNSTEPAPAFSSACHSMGTASRPNHLMQRLVWGVMFAHCLKAAFHIQLLTSNHVLMSWNPLTMVCMMPCACAALCS